MHSLHPQSPGGFSLAALHGVWYLSTHHTKSSIKEEQTRNVLAEPAASLHLSGDVSSLCW